MLYLDVRLAEIVKSAYEVKEQSCNSHKELCERENKRKTPGTLAVFGERRGLVFSFIHMRVTLAAAKINAQYCNMSRIYAALHKPNFNNSSLCMRVSSKLLSRLAGHRDPQSGMEEIQSTLRRWASISTEALGFQPGDEAEEVTDFEPLQLGQKIVLRDRRVPANLLAGLHELYKEDTAQANEALKAVLHGDFELPENLAKYYAFRAFFEEYVSHRLHARQTPTFAEIKLVV